MPHHLKLTASQRIALALTVLVITLDGLWLPWSHLSFNPLNWLLLAGLLLAAGMLYYLHGKLRLSLRLFHLLLNALLLLSFSLAGFVLSYLVSSHATTYYDHGLVRIDAALGFDWLAYNALFLQSTLLRALVLVLYLLVPLLPALIIIQLVYAARFERAAQCVLTIMLSSLACIGIAALLPSGGAVTYYQPDTAFYRGFTMLINWEYMRTVAALRNEHGVEVKLWQPLAVIAFPSFHACLAVITVLFAQRLGIGGWYLCGLSIAGLLAIPVEGGHHLVDVIAGICITLCLYSLLVSGGLPWRQQPS